jgi:heme oxygenase (biliverdin-IX-beta and delta-forming)
MTHKEGGFVAEGEALDTARGLIRAVSYGSLATLDRGDGAPVATLVAIASDRDASPLMLLSDLAEHTKNLAADARASLLIDGTPGLGERLTGPRLTVIGHIERFDDEAAGARYRLRHPESAMLSGFGDFHLYRLKVERAHQVAGFGRIDRIGGSDLLVPPDLAAEVAAIEPDAIRHMHDDHRAALEQLAAAAPGEAVELSGIDADGLDLTVAGRSLRVGFPRRLAAAGELRSAIAELARGRNGRNA